MSDCRCVAVVGLPVWEKNSIDGKSSRIPMVVVQDTTELLAPSDGALTRVAA